MSEKMQVVEGGYYLEYVNVVPLSIAFSGVPYFCPFLFKLFSLPEHEFRCSTVRKVEKPNKLHLQF
jgi:hypothetical protein